VLILVTLAHSPLRFNRLLKNSPGAAFARKMLRCKARDEGRIRHTNQGAQRRRWAFWPQARNIASLVFVQTLRGVAFRAVCFVATPKLARRRCLRRLVFAPLAKGCGHLPRGASRMQRQSVAPRHVGSGGEHGSRRPLKALLRLASLRTSRGATLREPSRKATPRPRGVLQQPVNALARTVSCSRSWRYSVSRRVHAAGEHEPLDRTSARVQAHGLDAVFVRSDMAFPASAPPPNTAYSRT